MKILNFKKIYIGVMWLMLCGIGVANAACRDDIPATTPTAEFTVHNGGTVTHHATGLMWMRCSLGQEWSGGSCIEEAIIYNWQSALQAAEGYTFADYSDWRVPNIKELESIVEYSCIDTAINATIFPATRSGYYWTSSSFGAYNFGAWSVSFIYGQDENSRKSSALSVRLVRTVSD